MKCQIKNIYYKSVPGNSDYLISLDQDVINTKREKVFLQKEVNFVNIEMYGKERKVDLYWLALISHYEVNLPTPFEERIFGINFVDCKGNVIRSRTNKMMIIDRPITVHKKYRIIPNFTDYAISKESELIDVHTGRVIPRFNRGKFNYPEVFIYSPEKDDYKHVKVHRLVALAWIKNNDYNLKPVINHKDFNKQNNHYFNLEWCSYSHNAIHSMSRHDSITKIVPCIVKNHLTAEVHRFPALSEVTKFIGNKYAISLYELKRYKKPKLFNGFFEIKEGHQDRGWYYDKLSDPTFCSNFTLYLSDNEKLLHIFYSAEEAIKDLNLNVSNGSIIEVIKAIKRDFPLLRMSFIDDFHLEAIECKNLKTNEVYCAENWNKLAKLANLSKKISKYNKYLKIRKQIKANGFIFRYKTNEPWDDDIEDVSIRGKRIIATNIFTNEVLLFESHTFAVEYFNIDIKTILRRMNKDSDYNGWLFKGESNNQFYLKSKPVIPEKV